MRHFLLFFLLAVTCSHARIRFNGQEAFLDQSTQSLLVVTDSSSLYDYAPHHQHSGCPDRCTY